MSTLKPRTDEVSCRKIGFAGGWACRVRYLSLRLATVLAALAVALLLAELSLAILKPQRTWSRLLEGRAKHFAMLSVFESCDYLPFRLKANSQGWIESQEFRHHWTINSHGLREPERPKAKQPGEFRILTLGDSFTVGHGVQEPECWPRVVERLAERSNRNVRVVNAGYAGGHAPDCYYAYLAHHLDDWRPDAIILALFAGNDSYEPIDHFWAQTDEHGLPLRTLSLTRYVDLTGRRRMTKAARPLAYQFPVLRESHLWVLLTQTLTPPLQNQEGFHSPHRHRYEPAMEQAYRRGVDCLKGIQRMAQERNIPFLVAVIPTAYQLDPDARSWVHLDSDFDPELPQSRWQTDLAGTGIDYLDLRPALSEAMEQKGKIWDLYYPVDRHFTPKGQQITAEAIWNECQQYLAR